MGEGRATFRGLAGWVLFDWAAQPFYTLVLTFLFAPYFANAVIGDPVRGQALWGYAIGAAGLVVALASPVLGAIADAAGRRKSWIAGFSLGLVIGLAGLWLAHPGAGASLPVILAALLLATVSVEFATVFTNAMMPTLVPADRLGRLSGTGWAVGYAGGLASLVVVTGLLVADPASGRTLLGLSPLLALDAASHQGDRLVGPFSALWYVVFVIPFFLFTPDHDGGPQASSSAVRAGLQRLLATARDARRYGGVIRFLLARMLYVDGLGAIFAFGGLYAASLFDWKTLELGLFGILLTVAGAIGALIGGPLDDRRGAKSVIVLSLAGLIAAALGVVSVDRQSVLFVVEVAPAAEGDAPFGSAGERVYLLFALLIGLMAGPLQAASRSLFARLAPPDMMTEFFGLYAFSGKVTAFAAPLLVGAVTEISGSPRLGVAVILVFLLSGLAILRGVEVPPSRAQ